MHHSSRLDHPALSSMIREQLGELGRHHARHESRDPVMGSLCELALQLFDAGLVSITLGDRDEQTLLVQRGDGDGAAAMRLGLHDETIVEQRPLLLSDLRAELPYRHLPDVTSAAGLQFYAGVPLLLHEVFPVGAFNLYDSRVHRLDSLALDRLALLGRLASHELSRRLDELRLGERARLLEQAAAMSGVGSWAINLKTGRVQWSRETYRLLEVPTDIEPDARLIGSFWTESSRESGRRLLDALIERGEPFEEIWDMRTAKGEVRQMRVVGRAEQGDGDDRRVIGSIQDVSSTKR